MASKPDGKSPKKTPKSKSPRKKDNNNGSPSPRASPRTKGTCDVSRRVRDLCATWHEMVQKWSTTNSIGLNVANNLMNLQLRRQTTDVDSSNSVAVLSDSSPSESTELEENILKTLEELSQIVTKMSQICNKMESITESFKAIQKLGNLKEIDDNKDEIEIFFNTWSLQQYCHFSQKLHAIYRKEMDLKEKLFPHFIRTKDRNQLMVYLSIWLNEPFLDDDKDVLLESMLIETGLR
ncbi:cyclin-dependent kinase 2-interacting protein [Exaiptasia diaphana]|uniref:Cyclin-dependent kinase 2-interacting protein n=1 Tax=Exaiptasia diaphana TaxID=2652724 RepID=A0A913XS75_EXADI|nr:cyclin-dependent kinase 2-interacting protein [Exaiptasia diaphana]